MPASILPSPTGAVRYAHREMWRRVVLHEAIHLFFILVTIVTLQHTVGAFEVEGASMEPTLHSRQLVVVDTFLPQVRVPQRGEVIVFRFPRDPEVEYVKRVVGLPGETVTIAHGRVWINGLPLVEPYVRDLPRYFWGPGRVPSGSVFVLGDNRNSSSDSHLWGFVPLTHVVGRAVLAWGPLADWTWLAGQPAPVVAVDAVDAAAGSPRARAPVVAGTAGGVSQPPASYRPR
jgi:signal peptidase I